MFHNTLVVGSSPTSSTTQSPPTGQFQSASGLLRYGAQRVEAACHRRNDIGATSYGSVASILKHGLDKSYAQRTPRKASRSGMPMSEGEASTNEENIICELTPRTGSRGSARSI